MPKYKVRRKDCKYYAEEAMRKLGWKVNSQIQEKYADKECAIVYTGIHTQLETQMSYRPTVYFKIVFHVDDNNDIFEVNDSIIGYITKYIEDSGADYCTSFYFESTEFIPTPGRSTLVELIGRFYYEKDWVSEF